MNWATMGLETGFTIFLAVIAFIIVYSAQMRITRTYRKFNLLSTKQGLSGFEVARKILDRNGLDKVHVVEVKGKLTDHYDPRRKVVRLSTQVFHENTIASVAVAAHEVGHALQDKNQYKWMRIRGSLVPIVNFVSYLGYITLLISIFGGLTAYLNISILLVLVSLAFQFITLPVEFDASKRALNELMALEVVDKSELGGAQQVLNAAAWTYVASVLSSLISLLRLVLMARDE